MIEEKTWSVFFAVMIIALVGGYGFVAAFSDLGPGETWALRITIFVAAMLFGGMGVGLLLREWWPVSAACGWGPFLLGCLALLANIRQGRWNAMLLVLLGMVMIPALSLLGGFAGFRIRQLFSRRG
jgi:hypothetical protein